MRILETQKKSSLSFSLNKCFKYLYYGFMDSFNAQKCFEPRNDLLKISLYLNECELIIAALKLVQVGCLLNLWDTRHRRDTVTIMVWDITGKWVGQKACKVLLIRIKSEELLIWYGGLYVHKQVPMKVDFLCICNTITLLVITYSFSSSLFSFKAKVHAYAY